jgi:hypothetical protein
VVVYASLFQPIQSRRGVDRVVRLRFPDDAGPVERLKVMPRGARDAAGLGRSCGGWLKDHGAWFCERSCWPTVRRALERAGHVVVVAAACR